MAETRICRGFQRDCKREAVNGKTLCKKCERRKASFKKYGISTSSTDALNYRYPGSFESGRKRR